MTIRRSMLVFGIAMAAAAITVATPPTAARAKSYWEAPPVIGDAKKARKAARPRWRQ
jgi:hypothetical protein